MDERHTFPKSERLQYGHQFRHVYERGHRVTGPLLVLHVLAEAPAAAGVPRAVGIVTSRKVGNAVFRNRARRLLREAYRLNKHKLQMNLQLVMVARSAIRGKRLSEVEAELLRLFRVADLLAVS